MSDAKVSKYTVYFNCELGFFIMFLFQTHLKTVVELQTMAQNKHVCRAEGNSYLQTVEDINHFGFRFNFETFHGEYTRYITL